MAGLYACGTDCVCLSWPCSSRALSINDILSNLQLKTEAKRKEQELADLEKLDVSLSAQIEESKKGKEDSVSLQHHQAPAVHCCTMLLTCRIPSTMCCICQSNCTLLL